MEFRHRLLLLLLLIIAIRYPVCSLPDVPPWCVQAWESLISGRRHRVTKSHGAANEAVREPTLIPTLPGGEET